MNETLLEHFFSFKDPEKLIFNGIEKECLRVNARGELSAKEHPRALGAKLTNPYITTDYSENLLEFITPPINDTDQLLSFLSDLHLFTEENLDEEYLWPNSMPGVILNEDEIQEAYYGSSNIGKLKTLYRTGLGYRYGKSMQTIAGIHYNFSLGEEFWSGLPSTYSKNDVYMGLMRNFRRYSYLLKYLFGMASSVHDSFLVGKKHDLKPTGKDTYENPNGLSLRVGDLGYTSKAQENIQVCFNEVDTYISTLENARLQTYEPYKKIGLKNESGWKQLNDHLLQIDNEYYSNIRPKNVAQSGESALQALHRRGIQYIEVRLTDLNPFEPLGISAEQINFYKVFLVWCLFKDSELISKEECKSLKEKFSYWVHMGFTQKIDPTTLAVEFEEMNIIAKKLGSQYESALESQWSKIIDPRKRDIVKWKQLVQNDGHVNTCLSLIKKRKYQSSLSEGQRKYFQQVAEKSVRDKNEIEANDHLSFDDFLPEYFAGIKI